MRRLRHWWRCKVWWHGGWPQYRLKPYQEWPDAAKQAFQECRDCLS